MALVDAAIGQVLSTKKLGFRDNALLSGLVTGDQLEEAWLRLRQKGSSARTAAVAEVSDRELAAMMVSLEFLTAYQADQLLNGRNKLTLGPYIITDWIGQGGMGQVFKAVHQMLGRESAVKVLPLHKKTSESIENFRREIRTQAKLDHPNLVRAFDAGVDGNVHYLVVEYVDGTDLRRLVRTKGMISVQQAASIIKQAAEGLEHAHLRGLIHRDIKPGNILVTTTGLVKVSDLGLAGHLTDNEGRTGKIVGTADYLAPEQIRSPLDVNKAADIYALGCTLYYAITGKVPFPGGNAKSKARRHLEETPWHPRRFNPEVSDEFVDLIGDMMEKDPRERIQSAAEVAERLAPWASDDYVLPDVSGARERWSTTEMALAGDEDTDPGGMQLSTDGAADSSGSESGSLRMGSSSAGLSLEERSGLPGGPSRIPTPPPIQDNSASNLSDRRPDEMQFSLTWVVIIGLASLGAGTLIGLLMAMTIV